MTYIHYCILCLHISCKYVQLKWHQQLIANTPGIVQQMPDAVKYILFALEETEIVHMADWAG